MTEKLCEDGRVHPGAKDTEDSRSWNRERGLDDTFPQSLQKEPVPPTPDFQPLDPGESTLLSPEALPSPGRLAAAEAKPRTGLSAAAASLLSLFSL